MTKLNSSRRLKQRGYVLFLMGAASIAVLGASGLALDMGRLYVNKQESQAFVDSAAIAAALELDGTAAGITRAKAVVTSSSNKWNMATSSVPAPTVEFATTKTGTYSATPVNPAGYIFARVTVTLPAKLYFLPLVNGKQYSQDVKSRAVAAQTQITKFGKGLGPYTAIAQTNTGPKFGLTVGSEYTIQWPAFNGGNNCKQNNPKGCFVKNPCPGDSDAAMWSVAKNWSSSTNGYWGFNSSADIRESVLDGKQSAPVSVGDNLFNVNGVNLMASGNMASQAGYLDERARSDQENSTNSYSTYEASSNHNGRRLLVVPIVSPQNVNITTVLGWGMFLLESNGASSNWYEKNTNGNDGYCAIYVGPYTMGSNDSGGATSGSGGYYVTLVI